jgi:hypothetical protein
VLLFRDRSLAVIVAFDGLGQSPSFSDEDERLLLAFAASAATAVATGQHVVAEGTRRSLEASERERWRWARGLQRDDELRMCGERLGPRRAQPGRAGVDAPSQSRAFSMAIAAQSANTTSAASSASENCPPSAFSVR